MPENRRWLSPATSSPPYARPGVTRGLYIGCGNGRNYLPLVDGGLDLAGLDISSAAITQLAARAPDRRHRLICGNLSVLPAAAVYPLVIGIQVFQHGDGATVHAHIRAAQQRVSLGGLFCLRVNATATVLATSLFGDAAAGFCEDASASLREHPARVRLPNLAPGLRVGNHRRSRPPAPHEQLPEADPDRNV